MSANNNRESALLANVQRVCAGCRRNILDRRYLQCFGCSQYWDIECANVSESRFYNTLTGEHRIKWTCPECACRLRKGGDNSETPVKSMVANTSHDISHFHVTDRREIPRSCLNVSEMSLDISQAQEEDSILDRGIVEPPTESAGALSLAAVNDAVMGVMRELRLFREEMRAELKGTRAQIDTLRDDMLQISGRMSRCEGHVSSIDERVRALEQRWSHDSEVSTARLDGVEQKLEAVGRRQEEAGPGAGTEVVAELERTVSALKQELNDRDQEALLADLEIGLLPEVTGETVLHSVTVLASRLGVTLEERDVVFAERVGAPPSEGGRPRRVVVRLARRHLRDELLRAARVRRSISAESGQRVFVNERLTRPNRQLFQHVREECRRLQWRYCWTRRGRIFVRRSDGAQAFQLRSHDDLDRVFGKGA